MAKIIIQPSLNTKIILELNENEARALEALAGYGTEAFLKIFYKSMGEHYLKPHEKGLAELFEKCRALNYPLQEVEKIRKTLPRSATL